MYQQQTLGVQRSVKSVLRYIAIKEIVLPVLPDRYNKGRGM